MRQAELGGECLGREMSSLRLWRASSLRAVKPSTDARACPDRMEDRLACRQLAIRAVSERYPSPEGDYMLGVPMPTACVESA